MAARSPASSLMDDEDLLCEILLRLPPQPSSLPRASLICKRWRRLVSDPSFFRRFRLRHRCYPPLLGFFEGFDGLPFLPTLEAPNRVPPDRFSLQLDDDDSFLSLGCRHGLVLIFLSKRLQIQVWDPITGEKHHIGVPAPFDTKEAQVNGAVLRDARDVQHFQVVLAVAYGDDKQHLWALACVYSSKTGLWGNLVSAPIPYQQASSDGSGFRSTMIYTDDAVLAGDSLYWKLAGNLFGFLEFDLVKQSLAVIRVPVDMCGEGKRFNMMRAEGGGLGLLLVSQSDCTAQLWNRKNNCDGVALWVLGSTIELDKLLSLKTEEKRPVMVLGFAEEINAVFLWTKIGLFLIHLESLKFKKLFETNTISYYHPFENVYPAGTCVGGRHDGTELLLNN